MRQLVTLILVCLLAGTMLLGSSHGAADVNLKEVAKQFGSPVVLVPKPKTAPVLDGKLDDACWNDATPVTLGHSVGAWWEPPGQKTEARMLADDKAIYFAVRCSEAEPDRIVSKGTPRPGMVVGADTVEFFLDPGHQQKRFEYFHLIVTAGGSVHTARGLDADKWKAPVTAKVEKNDRGWTVEAAIPMEDLGVKADAIPKVWGINVCRQRPELAGDMPKAARDAGNKRFDPSQWKLDDPRNYRLGEYTCWSPTMAEFSGWPFYSDSRPFHFAERFGHAVLEVGSRDVPPPAKVFESLFQSDFDDGKLGPFKNAALAEDNFRGAGKSMTFASGQNVIQFPNALENLDDVTLLLTYRGTPLKQIVAGGEQHLRISGVAPDGIRCGVERYEIFMTPEEGKNRGKLLEDYHQASFGAGPFGLYDTHADMVRWKPVGRTRPGPGPWAMVEGYFAEPSPTQVRWTGNDWVIVRIRLGLFRREPGPKQGQRLVPREQGYPKGLEFRANAKDNIRFDDVVIFRGADIEPPARVTGVKLQRRDGEAELSWDRARDNTLTAFYRVYNGQKLLLLTHRLTAKVTDAAGPLTVVAVDLYGNASEPSAAVTGGN